jgi:hypothetical protein
MGLAVATFLAATPWLRVFSVPGAAALLVVASMASVSIAFLAVRVWPQPVVVSYAVSALALVFLLLAAAGLHAGNVWHALTSGPNRVLTETLPLGGDRAVLAGPLVLTWICGAASAELMTRTGRSNSGWRAVGLAFPVACFVLAYAVGASRPGQDRAIAPLLLVTVAAVALLGRVAGRAGTRHALAGGKFEQDGRRSPWRSATGGTVAVVAVAVALALALPSASRLSGRPAALNRPAPLVSPQLTDPLDVMAGWRDNNPRAPARTVLRVHTTRASSGYLAAVILDNYDGGTWSFDATLRPTGGRIPAPAGPMANPPGRVGVQSVRQQDAVVSPLPVPFLPALDRPVRVTGLPIDADAGTGMLLPEQSAGRASYSVVSVAPVATLPSVPGADGLAAPLGEALPASGAISSADLTLPPGGTAALASALRFLATITGRRPAPTVAFLQAVLTSLHADERRIDPALPAAAPALSTGEKGKPVRPGPPTLPGPVRGSRFSGTSLSVVVNATTNDRRATPEQFATLFALAARYLGVPARLVTGFRMASTSAAGPVPAGDYQVTNRQAWTWVEIPVAAVGWVVADPTPDGVTGPGTPPPQPVQATPDTVQPNQANAVPRNEIAGAHALAHPATVPVPHPDATPWWALLLATLGGAVVLAALLGPGWAGARRILRRRARRQDNPSRLAVGAWLELLDALQQAGMTSAAGDTSAEVATEAGRHFDPDLVRPVQEVGAVADQALFSLSRPPDHLAANQAWETQQAVRDAVHRSLDRRQRLRAALAVGSAPRAP